jgi:hypothetical protein
MSPACADPDRLSKSSPSGFRIAGRRRQVFDPGQRDERNKARSGMLRNRLALTNCPGHTQCPRNDMPFREPNGNAALNLRDSLCEARGIGSAGLKGYHPGGRTPAGSKQIASILKLLADQRACFKVLQTSGAGPSPSGSPRLAIGLRDSMSRRDGVSIRMAGRVGQSTI